MKEGYTRVSEVLDIFSRLHLVDPDVLDRAKTRGNEVDMAYKMVLEGLEPFQLPDELDGYMKSFLAWKDGKEFLPNPGRMYCDTLMLTGECDGIYKSDRGLILFDIKTPANESRAWPLQGAAYVYLARLIGHDIKGIEFVKLSKEAKSAKVYEYEYEKNWELFKKCFELYQYFFAKKKKKTAVDN